MTGGKVQLLRAANCSDDSLVLGEGAWGEAVESPKEKLGLGNGPGIGSAIERDGMEYKPS